MHRGHHCQERGGRFKARWLSIVRSSVLSSRHDGENALETGNSPFFPENLFCVLNVDLL